MLLKYAFISKACLSHHWITNWSNNIKLPIYFLNECNTLVLTFEFNKDSSSSIDGQYINSELPPNNPPPPRKKKGKRGKSTSTGNFSLSQPLNPKEKKEIVADNVQVKQNLKYPLTLLEKQSFQIF